MTITINTVAGQVHEILVKDQAPLSANFNNPDELRQLLINLGHTVEVVEILHCGECYESWDKNYMNEWLACPHCGWDEWDR